MMYVRLRWLTAIALASAAGVPGIAHAQPAPAPAPSSSTAPAPTPASAPVSAPLTDQVKARTARQYVDAGLAAQGTGDYATAITFYQKAYDLVPHPRSGE